MQTDKKLRPPARIIPYEPQDYILIPGWTVPPGWTLEDCNAFTLAERVRRRKREGYGG